MNSVDNSRKQKSMKDGLHNAKIVSTYLGYEDHGMIIVQVDVDYGGSRQSLQINTGKENFIEAILKIIHQVKVRNWESLPGCYVKVFVHDGLIRNIYNILDFIEKPERMFPQ